MRTPHTPGPWSITCNRVHGAVDSGANTGIADMLGNCGVTATVNANARLIAAAPELLEALEALLTWGQNWVSPIADPAAHLLLIEAHNAIAKATINGRATTGRP